MDGVIRREVLVVLSFTLGTGYTLGDGRFVVGLFGRGNGRGGDMGETSWRESGSRWMVSFAAMNTRLRSRM